MLATPLLDSSSADKGPQFAVGEVVNGEFRVHGVEADDQGRIVHKCSRLSNGEDVVVYYEGRNGQLGAWPSYQSSPEVPSVSGMNPAGRFEVQFGTDTLYFRVYAERKQKGSSRQKKDFERGRAPTPVQRRPGPAGTRCAVYRKGDCELEVDIPANGCNCQALCAFGFTGLFIVIAFVFGCIMIPGGMLGLLIWAAFGIVACLILWSVVARVFGHESVTIAPEHFKIERNLELIPSLRDSGNNARAAAAEATCLDAVLLKQVSGDTRNLWKAEVKINVSASSNSSNTSITHYLTLMEGVKEHKLGQTLTDTEKNWIAQEINEVLENIKRAAGEV